MSNSSPPNQINPTNSKTNHSSLIGDTFLERSTTTWNIVHQNSEVIISKAEFVNKQLNISTNSITNKENDILHFKKELEKFPLISDCISDVKQNIYIITEEMKNIELSLFRLNYFKNEMENRRKINNIFQSLSVEQQNLLNQKLKESRNIKKKEKEEKSVTEETNEEEKIIKNEEEELLKQEEGIKNNEDVEITKESKIEELNDDSKEAEEGEKIDQPLAMEETTKIDDQLNDEISKENETFVSEEDDETSKENEITSKNEQELTPTIPKLLNINTQTKEEDKIKSPRDLKVIVQNVISPRYKKRGSMIEMMKNKLKEEANKSNEKKVPSSPSSNKMILKMHSKFMNDEVKSKPSDDSNSNPNSNPSSPLPSLVNSSPSNQTLERKSSKISLEIKREKCYSCDKTVYQTEKMIAGKNVYHQKCFKCSRCKTKLTIQNYVIYNSNEQDEKSKLFCKVHYEEIKNKRISEGWDQFKKKYKELE
eukprot:gene8422-247_t